MKNSLELWFSHYIYICWNPGWKWSSVHSFYKMLMKYSINFYYYYLLSCVLASVLLRAQCTPLPVPELLPVPAPIPAPVPVPAAKPELNLHLYLCLHLYLHLYLHPQLYPHLNLHLYLCLHLYLHLQIHLDTINQLSFPITAMVGGAGPESTKCEQNYLGNVNWLQIHQNRGFRGWGIQIWGQNLISRAR